MAYKTKINILHYQNWRHKFRLPYAPFEIRVTKNGLVQVQILWLMVKGFCFPEGYSSWYKFGYFKIVWGSKCILFLRDEVSLRERIELARKEIRDEI